MGRVAAAAVSGTTALAAAERGPNRIYGLGQDRPRLRRFGRAFVLAVSAGVLLPLVPAAHGGVRNPQGRPRRGHDGAGAAAKQDQQTQLDLRPRLIAPELQRYVNRCKGHHGKQRRHQ